MKVLLVTGGAGFVGSSFIKYFLRRNKNFIVVNLDKTTYNPNNDRFKEIENSPRYHFIKGDTANYELVNYIMRRFKPDFVVNFAALKNYSNNDINAASMASSNIQGIVSLVESARFFWGKSGFEGKRFVYVSNSGVYGNGCEYALEETPINPFDLFSATSAGAELMLKTYRECFGVPVIVTRCCETYGPFQDEREFIPSVISNVIQNRAVALEGTGLGKRELVYVIDHCIGIIRAMFYGKPGEIYNIGSGEGIEDVELVKRILKIMGKEADISASGSSNSRSISVLNSYKIRNNLGWSCKMSLDDGLKETIKWVKEDLQLKGKI